MHAVVRAVIAAPAQLLEQPLRRPALPPRQISFLLQDLGQNLDPFAQLRRRLDTALVLELGRLTADHLAHRRARYRQRSHDLLDRPVMLKIRAPYLANHVHANHPQKPFPADTRQKEGDADTQRQRGSQLDAKTAPQGVTIAREFTVRAAWKNARWQQRNGEPLDLLGMLGKCKTDRIDEPVWIGRRNGPTLALRLIAARKSEADAAESRRRARRQAQKDGYQLSQNTLAAADWFILVTSLKAAEFSAEDVLALYRLRWRVELGFKRLKSLIGLHGPPGTDARSARPYILAHLVMLLLLEPLVDALEDSPRGAYAA